MVVKAILVGCTEAKFPLVLNVCECLLIEIAFGDRTGKKNNLYLPKSSGIGFYLDNTAQLYSTTAATFKISIAYITYLYAKKIREIELILYIVTVLQEQFNFTKFISI